MTGPAVLGRQPVLVTGGAGFIGSNIADRLASEGHHVHVYDALSRPGVERNLDWLKHRHPRLVSFTRGDVRDEDSLAAAARQASAVFHMAAQVAVTTSMVDPREDFDINVRGTLHLLDEIDFGDWTGQRFADLDGQPAWDHWNRARSTARCPGGESMAEAQARALAFAFEAAARHHGEVVLVTHCDIIRALLCWAERRSLDDILSFEAGPASATPLDLAPRALAAA